MARYCTHPTADCAQAAIKAIRAAGTGPARPALSFGQLEMTLGQQPAWLMTTSRQVARSRAQRPRKGKNREVSRLHYGPRLDLAYGRHGHPGAGCGLLLCQSCFLSERAQPLSQGSGLLAMAAVCASAASWARHPAILG